MAITNYDELQTHLQARLARGDIDDIIPVFIAEAEKRIAASVSLPAMQSSLSLTLSEGDTTVAVPSDYLRMQGSLYKFKDDTRTALTQLSEEAFHLNHKDVTGEGAPSVFYITHDGYFSFDATADADYTLIGTYYKLLALSDTTTTTWILTNYPMAIVYGAMFEAYVYTSDDPREYAALFDEQIAKMRRYNNQRRHRFGARTFTQVGI